MKKGVLFWLWFCFTVILLAGAVALAIMGPAFRPFAKLYSVALLMWCIPTFVLMRRAMKREFDRQRAQIQARLDAIQGSH